MELKSRREFLSIIQFCKKQTTFLKDMFRHAYAIISLMSSVENEECGVRSAGCGVRSVESAECGKCGV